MYVDDCCLTVFRIENCLDLTYIMNYMDICRAPASTLNDSHACGLDGSV